MREGNIVSDIIDSAEALMFDLGCAEGRADLDDHLHARLDAIADERLRAHAAEMLRDWRRKLFEDLQNDHR